MSERVKLIKYGPGRYAIVDAEDFEWLSKYTWGKHTQGYAMRCMHGHSGRKIFMHRDIMKAEKGHQIDHRDGDVSDNRKANLRFCTRHDNARNRKKLKTNTSGYVGVRFEQGFWRARLWVNGKGLHVGNFKSPEAAARARDEAAKKYHGSFARLNFND